MRASGAAHEALYSRWLLRAASLQRSPMEHVEVDPGMASLMKGAVGVNSASRLEFRVWCAGVGTRLGAWARREGGREDGSERGRQGGICRRMAWGRLIQAEPRADLRVARRSVAHRGVARHNPSHFSLGQCLQCLLRAESVAWENDSSRKNTCPTIEYVPQNRQLTRRRRGRVSWIGRRQRSVHTRAPRAPR